LFSSSSPSLTRSRSLSRCSLRPTGRSLMKMGESARLNPSVCALIESSGLFGKVAHAILSGGSLARGIRTGAVLRAKFGSQLGKLNPRNSPGCLLVSSPNSRWARRSVVSHLPVPMPIQLKSLRNKTIPRGSSM